jgi:peptide/nickel transport system permease protein
MSAYPADPANRSSRAGQIIQDLFSRPSSALGAALVLLFLFLALFGPLLAPYGENQQIAGAESLPPSPTYWFGTDHLGRDVFSRVVLGARDVLVLAGLGTLLAVLLGTALGLLSGYRGGWLDETLMRFLDAFLAIPAMLLALMLLGAIGASQNSVLIVLIVVYTPIVTRVVRSSVLATRQLHYVESARLLGASQAHILLREILPAVIPALNVEAAMRFSYAIFLVASLGYLGLGVQPPSPDWGLMVKEARLHVNQTPWAFIFPTMAISLLVIGVNLAADGLKRAWRTLT